MDSDSPPISESAMSRHGFFAPPRPALRSESISSASADLAPQLGHHESASPVSISVHSSTSSHVTSGVTSNLLDPSMLDPQKIYKGLTEAQQKVVQLQKENTQLKAENASLSMRVATLTRRRGAKRDGGSTNADGNNIAAESIDAGASLITRVQKMAQHHQLFWCIILDGSHFARVHCPSWKWDDFERRYATPEDQKCGPIAELYSVIPSQYHDLMDTSNQTESAGKDFVREFLAHMSSSRSTSIAFLRTNAAHIFEAHNIPVALLQNKSESSVNERESHAGIRQLLGYSINTNTKQPEYARFPPILCQDSNTTTPNKRFLNPVLFRVARGVLFGVSAISSPSAAVARSTSMYLPPNKPAETTFGLIAWVAIMTRYILTKDKSFTSSGVGKETKITYYSDYDFSKRWLLQARKRDPGWVSYLFAIWNNQIFLHHNKTAGNFPDAECETIALDADADEIARDLEGLHFDALSEPGLASRLQVPQSESQTFLPSSGSEVPSDTVNMQIPIHDDIDLNSVADHDDIYEPLQPPGIVHRDVGSGSDHDDIYEPLQPTGIVHVSSGSGSSQPSASAEVTREPSIQVLNQAVPPPAAPPLNLNAPQAHTQVVGLGRTTRSSTQKVVLPTPSVDPGPSVVNAATVNAVNVPKRRGKTGSRQKRTAT